MLTFNLICGIRRLECADSEESEAQQFHHMLMNLSLALMLTVADIKHLTYSLCREPDNVVTMLQLHCCSDDKE